MQLTKNVLSSRTIVAVLLFLFITAIIPGLPGMRIDQTFWKTWAVLISKEGLQNVYNSAPNYPPLYHYIIWIFTEICGNAESIEKNIGYLRVFTLAAEYWGLWIVWRWMDKTIDYTTVLLISMLNIAYSYNTIIWGQIDAMLAALAMASLYYLYKGKNLRSALLMVLALNLKLQAIVFIPMWGLLMIAGLHSRREWRQVLYIVPAMVLLQAILLLPFAFGQIGLAGLWKIITGLVGSYPSITMHAFNMWYWIAEDAGPGNPDSVPGVAGLSYYHIGLFSFSLALAVILWPVIRYTWLTLRGRDLPALPKEIMWLTAALSILAFFFFNTRMHERYSHPAFIFITAYAFFCRQYGLYLLFSVAYFLNMEKTMQWLRLRNYDTLVFDPRFIALLFAGCIAWCLILLFKRAKIYNRTFKYNYTLPAIEALNY